MATLTGKKVKDTYKDLLQVSNSNSGIDSTLRTLADGEGTDSVLQLSSAAVNISSAGALQYAGTAITSTAAELNILDGVTSTASELNLLDGVTGGTVSANLAVVVDSNKDIGTFRNLTLSGNLIADSIDVAGDITLDADGADVILKDGGTEYGRLTQLLGGLTLKSGSSSSNAVIFSTDGDAIFAADVSFPATMTFDSVALTAVQASSESFADNDTSLMTSAAINDRIESFGYITSDTTLSSEQVQDIAGAMFSSNTETGITATYQDADGTIDLVVGTLNQDTTGNADTATKIASITNSNIVQLTDTQTLSNKTLASPTFTGDVDFSDATTPKFTITDTTNTVKTEVRSADTAGAIGTITDHNLSILRNGVANFILYSGYTMHNNGGNDVDFRVKDSNDNVVFKVDAGDSKTHITTLDVSGDADIDGTLEADAITVNGTALNTVIAGVTVANATLAATATVSDSTANTNFPVVFHNESNGLLDDTGALRYNPSTGELLVPKLTVAGTTTTVDTVTMNAANAIKFEGATADANETILSIVDPTNDDNTQYLLNASGYIPLLNAASTTVITATPAELNYVDGVTSNIQTQLDATLDTAGTGIDISSTTISVDVSDFMANGADNYIVTATGTDAMNAEANLTFDGTDLAIASTGKLYFDGAGDTYIEETSADVLDFFVGGQQMLRLYEGGTDYVHVQDNTRLGVGNSPDFYIYHDATNTHQINTTGDLYIKNAAQDEDIYFQVNDGGSTTTVMTIDGDVARVGIGTASPTDTLQVEGSIGVGVGRDGQLTSVNNGLVMRSLVSDADMYFYVNDGGVDTLAMKMDGSAVGNVSLPNDNQGLHIGASSDLQLYHQSDHNYILTQKADADLFIRHNTSGGYINAIQIDGSDSGTAIFNHDVKVNDDGRFTAGTGNDLYMMHDGSNSYFVNKTGHLYIQQQGDDKDIVLQSDDGSGGVTAYLTLDGSASLTKFHIDTKHTDSVKGIFGDSSDLQIYHDGSNNYIDSATSDQDLYIRVNDGGSTITALQIDASNVGQVKLPNDNQVFSIGAGDDLAMYHNGSNSFFYNANVGDLIIQNNVDDQDISLRSDDGSGGVAEYLRLDGGLGYMVASKHILFGDNVKARFGGSADLEIIHDTSNSYITNNTGDLYIRNNTDDGVIFFQTDDGSGGVTDYIKINGSESLTRFKANTRHNDNITLQIGSSGDMDILHDGTNSIIRNDTGNLEINQRVDDGDIILKSDDGSGGTTAYLTIDGSAELVSFDKATRHKDSVIGYFGTGLDFRIYHNGSNSYLDNQTGGLFIDQNVDDSDITFRCDDGSGGTTPYITLDGSESRVDFFSGRIHLKNDGTFHWGSAAAHGVLTWDTGRAIVTSLGSNNLDLKAQSGYSVVVNESGSNVDFRVEGDTDTHLIFADASADRVGIGTSSPDTTLDVFASGVNGILLNQQTSDSNTSARLMFKQDDTTWVMYGSGGNLEFRSGGTVASSSGSAQFRITEGSGVRIVNDNDTLALGAGEDLYMYHDGSDSFIRNQTGGLYIDQTLQDGDMFFRVNDGGVTTNTLQLDGATADVYIQGSDLIIKATKKLYFDGKSDTYIHETSADNVEIVVGGANLLDLVEDSTDYVRVRDNTLLGVGSSNDMNFKHNGTDSFISNGNGKLYIDALAQDEDFFIRVNDGGSTITALKIDSSDNGTVYFANDNQKLMIGAGSDLRLWHDGTNSNMYNYVGNLLIGNATDDGDIILYCDDGSGNMTAYLTLDGSETNIDIAVDTTLAATKKLYFDGGSHTWISEVSDDLLEIHVGNTRMLKIEEGSDDFVYTPDNIRLAVGNAKDLQISHNATNSYIQNYTGDLYFQNHTTDGDIHFLVDDGGGNDITAIQIDASDAGTAIFNHDILLNKELSAIRFGASQQGSIYEHASDIVVSNSAAGNDTIFENLNSAGTEYVKNLFIDGSTSRVGIGTTSPLSKLHIEETTNDADALMIRQVAGGSGSVQGKVHIGMNHFNSTYPSVRITAEEYDVADYRGNLAFSTRAATSDAVPTEKMRITHDGSVGIGTTSPSTNLEVSDSANGGGVDIVVANTYYASSSTDEFVAFQGEFYQNDVSANRAGGYMRIVKAGDFSNNSNASAYMFFATRNAGTLAEKMRIEADGDVHCDQDVIAFSTTPSDIRLKENFEKIENGLDVVSKLEGHTFNWKKGGDRLSAGFKAQEVEKILPHLVDEKKLPLKADDDKEYKILRYEEMIPYLVEAIKEQQVQIDELKTKIGDSNG